MSSCQIFRTSNRLQGISSYRTSISRRRNTVTYRTGPRRKKGPSATAAATNIVHRPSVAVQGGQRLRRANEEKKSRRRFCKPVEESHSAIYTSPTIVMVLRKASGGCFAVREPVLKAATDALSTSWLVFLHDRSRKHRKLTRGKHTSNSTCSRQSRHRRPSPRLFMRNGGQSKFARFCLMEV